jgi:serine/threonine protein phosphatase PrpC
VIGKQHELAGGRCEDACHAARGVVRATGREIVAACICDGAGSVAKGWLGATLVSKVVANWLVANFPALVEMSKSDASHAVIATALRPLRRLAAKSDARLREFACTLVAIAAAEDGQWIAIHLGDGGILGQFQEGLKAVCLPKKGAFANETFFVTDVDAEMNVEIQTSPGSDVGSAPIGFALFSDGVEACLVNRRSMEIAPAVSSMLAWLLESSEEEVSKAIETNIRKVFREKSEDDCTLALLVRTTISGFNARNSQSD